VEWALLNIWKTKIIMKQGKHLIWLVLIISTLYPLYVEAKHIIGGTIYYECLGETSPGNKRFRFTMKVYRDCQGGGAAFDDPAEFAIYRGSSTANVRQEGFKVGLLMFTKLIPDTPQCVQKIPNVCVEEATYVFERVLSVSATQSYFIVYQRCCRNETIKNLIDPGDKGATFMIELTPEAQKLCNNSPQFTNFPPIVICNNVPLEFDHSAIDKDGDQLIYSFCPPLDGGGNILQAPGVYSCEGAVPTPPCNPPFDPVPFVAPAYTPTSPMGGNPKISINAIDGRIVGTPNQLGQYVVAVCVREFRNGVLLSTSQREFQFNVADCQPSVLAIIDTAVLSKGVYEINSCGSLLVNIYNKSFERDNITKFKWVFQSNGFNFQDSTNWEVVTVPFPDTGHYTGRLLLNPGQKCGDTAQLKVNIYPPVKADFSYDYDTCVAGPITFRDSSSGIGIIEKWDWNFGVPGGVSTEVNPIYQYETAGTRPASLTVTDRNHCQDTKTVDIAWYPAPAVILVRPDSYLGCIPGKITFDNLSKPIDNTYHIVWNFGDGSGANDIISPSHVYTIEGVYDVSLAITSPIGCYIDTVFKKLIRVQPSPTAAFDCDPDTLLTNLNNTVQFIDKSLNANRWNWTIGKYLTTNMQNPTFTFPDTGLVKVRLIVTHPQGCKDSLTKVLDIRPEIRWFMPNAFTPNNDGTNEGFLGKGFLFGVQNFKMTIWNRWGEQVFETSNPEEAWNGRVRNVGEMSPAGVYVYVVTFTGPRGERNEYKGFATLVK
jgi:gliding motility-associated-like protein